MENNYSLEKKWQRFHKRARVFNYIPFVDFVLAAGSMATGKAHEGSDFDVIVAAREGRIFTVRFLSFIFTSLLGIRAKSHNNLHDKLESADKICLSHFITPASYRLSPPHNEYWKALYESLAPLIGDEERVRTFFQSNNWVDVKKTEDKHKLAKPLRPRVLKAVISIILSGRFGDWVEKALKNIQIRKIKSHLGLEAYHNPHLIYSDIELQFHPKYEQRKKKLEKVRQFE